VLELAPLAAPECDRLVGNLLGQSRLPAEVRSRIVDTAEGNPLFVEEMLRMLIDEGVLRRDDGQWVPVGDLWRVSPPRTIQALLAARLDRLQEEERSVIQRASVVGKVFYWGAVTELSPESVRTSVGSHLQTLPEPSPFAGEDAFRFSHILVRDAAYESIPKRTRAELQSGSLRGLSAWRVTAFPSTRRSWATTSSRPTDTVDSSVLSVKGQEPSRVELRIDWPRRGVVRPLETTEPAP
jgi:predicted ATPase